MNDRKNRKTGKQSSLGFVIYIKTKTRIVRIAFTAFNFLL
jgi:hypothetical protein